MLSSSRIASRPWVRDLIILVLGIVILQDRMHHTWKAGIQIGFQQGYQQGLAAQPQMWNSAEISDRIN